MTKEETYDSEVFPLMKQIIEICKREKIAFVANFTLGDDLACTSALLEDEYEPTKDQLCALSILKDGYVAFAVSRSRK